MLKKNQKKKISNFLSTEIEWVAQNKLDISTVDKIEILDFLETLEEEDDVQNIYTNAQI